MKGSSKLTVGSFPYSPGFNPYQRLFTEALEGAGIEVLRIAPLKWLPLQRAINSPCDMLHIDWPHDWYNGKNFMTRMLKSLMYRNGLRHMKRKPVVWTAHNLAAHDAMKPRYEHAMMQSLIDNCQGIMVMSNAAEQELRRRYSVSKSTDVRVIYHGHYIDAYQNTMTRENARKQLDIPDDEFVLLNFGSLRPYKGHLQLIEQFASIGKKGQRLVIAGAPSDGEYVTQLQESISSISQNRGLQIDLHARSIAEDELQVFFNASDVCVLPFDRVLNSGSLILAMSFGKPVIAPRMGSIPEIACPDFFFDYDPHDSGGLRDALQRALALTPAQQAHSAHEIREFTRTKYDWEKIGMQLADWYQKLAA